MVRVSRNNGLKFLNGIVRYPGTDPTRKIRVVLVDDDRDLRMLLRLRLEGSGLFTIVGEAGDGGHGAAVAEETQPDSVVLDVQMPDIDGLAAIPRLMGVAPRSRIIVLSSFPDPYTLADVLHLGADAYLDKAHAWTELIPTLLAVTRQTGFARA